MQNHILKFNAPKHMPENGICQGMLKQVVHAGTSLLMILISCLFQLNAQTTTPYVSNVRLGAHHSYTRVVLDLSVLPNYEIFSLTSPNRIIIDLPEVTWNLHHKTRQAGLVSAVRYGLYHKGRSRIVLDINHPSKLRQAFIIPATTHKPHRLVIDLIKTSSKRFQANLNKTLASRGKLPNLSHKQMVQTPKAQPSQIQPIVTQTTPSQIPQRLSDQQKLAAATHPSTPKTASVAIPHSSRVIAPQQVESAPPTVPTSQLNSINKTLSDSQRLSLVSQAQPQTTVNTASSAQHIPDLEKPFQQIMSLANDQPTSTKKRMQTTKTDIIPPLPSARPQNLLPQQDPKVADLSPKQTDLGHKNIPVIVIDPGHGGIDPGATGAQGTREKHITLKMAHELKSLLEDSGKYHVYLTRTKDEFIRLRNRFHIAEEWGAHLFISLHADSVENGYPRGASIYTLSEDSSDREAAQLAKTENKVDLLAGINLEDQDEGVQPILIDLQQRKTMELSNDFAETVVASLRKNKVRVLENAHRSAGFAVLKSPNIPSILIEMGFLSSPKEEWLLKQSSHRQRIGKALVQAIDQYFFNGIGAKLLIESDRL